MKTYVLTLMLFTFLSLNTASHPYGADDTLSSTGLLSRTSTVHDADVNDERTSTGYDADADDERTSTFFTRSDLIPQRKGSAQHIAIDVDAAGSNKFSTKSYLQVNPSAYFDRDEYLKEHVKEMQESEKRYKLANRICRWCNIFWLGVGGISTATSLIISAVGATEYVDPQLANVLCVIFGVVSGGSIWVANQSKKAAHEYHEEVNTIQKSLGVPSRWLESEVDLGLAPYEPEESQRIEAAPAH